MNLFDWIAKPLSEEMETQIDPRAVFLMAGESRFVVNDGEELFLVSDVELHDDEKFIAAVSVELSGTGKCYVRRTARLCGARAIYDVCIGVVARDASRIFVDDWVSVAGASADVRVCTRVVLEHAAVSRVRAWVRVAPEARGAKVTEELKQLLMDQGTRGMNIPELDVGCADAVARHAASIVPPPESVIGYLRTRGICKQVTRELVARGFLRL